MFRKVEFNKDGPRLRFAPALQLRIWPRVNERVPVIGNYSEVMMHFGLADKPIEIALKRTPSASGETICYSAQVYVDGVPFSSRITTGEAGFYCDDHDNGEYYCYPDHKRIDPRELFAP